MKSVIALRVLCVLISLCVLEEAAPAAAQTPTPPKLGKVTIFPQSNANFTYVLGSPADPLADAFFAPELVMRHQQKIGLSGEQRAAIIRAIQEAQPRFIEAQWQLEPETTALAEIVKGTRVDERRVLQQIDRVLEIERQIKRSQIELLVQIKNQLTEEQQTELARLGGSRGLLQGNLFPPIKR